MTRQAKLAFATAAGLSAAAVLFLCDPAHCSFYPVCPFHRLTGLDCPGCGATRALHQLLRGHLREALVLNPLVVAALPVVGLSFVRRKKPAPAQWRTCVLLSVVVMFWILRNTEVYRSMLPNP